MTRAGRIALWGNFGSGNIGNEATLQAMAYNLRRLLPLAEVSCICSVPQDTQKRHGLPASPISPTRGQPTASGATRLARVRRAGRRLRAELGGWRHALAEVRGLDLLVIAGTGMLSDDGEGVLGLPHDVFKWSLAAWAARTPHVFVSVGVERVDAAVSRFFLRTAVRLARYTSYRDVQSQQAMARLGCGRRAPIYPDLAFSMPETIVPGWRPDAGARPRTAVGLYDAFERGRHRGADRDAYRSYLQKTCAFVLWLLDRGHDVRIVIGDIAYDLPVLDDFRALLDGRQRGRAGTLCDEPARSVEQLLDQLASVDLLVATRYHNLLLGFLLGHPALAISHQAKDDALMAEMGLGGYCHPLAQLDVDRLIGQFRELEANASRLRPAILAAASRCRAQLDEQYRALLAGLGTPGPAS